MQKREGVSAVVRQGQLIVVMLVVLVMLLYPAPTYAQVDTSAGQPPPRYSVEAGTPLTVLGRYHGSDPNCPPPERPCKPFTWAVVRLPDGNVVLLPPSLVNYQTQTARFDSETPKSLTPEQVDEVLGLPGTGGAALLPLLGAAMLIGGALVAGQLVTMTRYAVRK